MSIINKFYFSNKVLIVPLLYSFLSCGIFENNRNKFEAQNAERIKFDTIITNGLQSSMEDKFKLWLNDTLKILNSSHWLKDMPEGAITREIIISPDSLTLELKTQYDLIIKRERNIKLENKPNVVLYLLREYNEYPIKNFRLRFEIDYVCNPTSASQLTHDMYDEYNDIEVIEENGKVFSKYDYIRGRLSDKTVMKINKDGTKERRHINFIWDGNKLIKR